jgi:hypothetical protein
MFRIGHDRIAHSASSRQEPVPQPWPFYVVRIATNEVRAGAQVLAIEGARIISWGNRRR